MTQYKNFIFQNINKESKIDPSLILLSIYLFILIFFILLNSTSKSHNNNVNLAALSIAKTFNGHNYVEKNNKNSKQELIDLGRLYYLDKILFIRDKYDDFELIPSNQYDKTNIAKLYISTTSIFLPNTIVIRQKYIDLFKDISKLTENKSANGRLQIEITMSCQEDADILKKKMVLEQIEQIRNLLIKYGCHERFFKTGMHEENESSIIFSFHVNDEYYSTTP